jgi:cytoskeleton protein RodZ
MPTTPFGDRLKRERELRGVTLEEIAKATRIKVTYLEALETENWPLLPGGAFNRGYIRTIARYLGMDEENILAEYSMARQEQSKPTRAPHVETREKAPSIWTRMLAARMIWTIAIGTLAIAAWFGYYKFAGARHDSTNPQARPAITAPRPAPSSPPPNAPIESAIVPLPKPEVENPPVPSNIGSDVVDAATLPPYIVLKIEAGKNARIRVSADHHRMYAGHISAGETKRYRARNIFEISSSDSGAVLIELEGQTMPPLGPSGQPGRATFTRRDLGAAAGGTH